MKYNIQIFSDCDVKTEKEEDYITLIPQVDCEEFCGGYKIVFDDWEDDCYIMMPACAYNGNRFKVYKTNYPPIYKEKEPVEDIHISDVPRLNRDGSGKIEVTTGDMSVPCVCIYFKKRRKGFILFTTQGHNGINFGVTVKQGEITVSYPKMRDFMYRMCTLVPSDDKKASVSAQEKIKLGCRIEEFDCCSETELIKYFFEHRKCIYDGTRADTKYTDELFEALENKYNKFSYNTENDFYQITYTCDTHYKWQIGWVGGGLTTYPLLVKGKDISKERAEKTLEFLLDSQRENGLFPPVWDGEWKHDGFDESGEKNIILVRRLADTLFFLIKQLPYVKYLESRIKDAVRKLADAFVKLWNDYSDFGQFISYDTGMLWVKNTASGALAVGGLVKAYELFNDEKYLRVAEEAGEYYYNNFTAKGYTCGGPGEALSNPDSESCAALLESYVTMYECIKDRKWLEYAENTAHLLSSWTVGYRYEFPKESQFGKMNVNTVGSVFANVQNKHSAPGLCTLSCSSLKRLYRYTGNDLYNELYLDIKHFLPQVVAMPNNEIEARMGENRMLEYGSMCERVNMSDWESYDFIGEVYYMASGWCETNTMMNFIE